MEEGDIAVDEADVNAWRRVDSPGDAALSELSSLARKEVRKKKYKKASSLFA